MMHIYLVTLRSAPFARIKSRFLDMLSLHKIMSTMGVGVSVAKAQRPGTVVAGP
jgi:hypothetical protein